ncbi:MAG: OsmC family protein [Candidatus Methylomirabilales bacterium]
MGITMRMYAQRKGWELGQVEIILDREKDSKGVLSEIKMHIDLGGNMNEDERTRLRDIASRCPTHKVLSRAVPIVEV